MSMTAPGQRQRPPSATDPSVLAAAAAAMPDLGVNDDEVLPPTATDRAPVDTNEYEFEEDGAPAAGQPPAAGTAPAQAAKPASSTAGASGEQPTAPAASPPQAAAPAQTASVDDPWAETEDLTYEDSDTGESYTVRAPKRYADKVKGGYARRSIMDRNSGYLGKHRKFLEPIITSNQFGDIAPVLELGMRDQEFARYVAAAHARRMAGLPLDYQQQQVVAATPQQAPPAQAPQPGEMVQQLRQQMLAKLEGVDDYTRDAIVASYEPLLNTLEAQQRVIDGQTQAAAQSREAQQRQQQAYDADRQLGVQANRALREALPDQFNDRTTRDEWLRVMQYAESSGMLQRFGHAPGTFVLAAQALRSPLGLAGIGQAPATSVAAQSIADVRRQAEATAAQAAQAVGRQTATNAPGGADNPPPAAAPRVPRFVKDKRTGAKRPMSPTEIAKWMETHGGAR